MKNAPTWHVVLWTVLLGLLVSAPAVTAVGVELPDGISVSLLANGRNQVWVTIGDDVLAVDPASQSPVTERPLRFAIATGAVDHTVIPTAIELVPNARMAGAVPSSATSITLRTGFTIGGGDRQIVILSLGRCATAADAVIWVPRDKTLITGRLCDRTGVAATAQSDTVAWIEALDDLLDLEPAIIIPGQGATGGPELLTDQRDRLSGLRAHGESGLRAGKTTTQAAAAYTAPWFTAWQTEKPEAAMKAFHAVCAEIGGLVPPWELMEERKLREGPSPTRDAPGWTKPRKVLWRNYWPDRLPMLRQVAPGVEIVPFETTEQALADVGDADALIGTATADLLAAGKKLRWVQVGSAGVERYLMIPELKSGAVLLSNGQRMASAMIGEHVMALTRALARGLNQAIAAQTAGEWRRSEIGNAAPLTGLRGKTMLVVGLGGIGTEVARLADGAGMRVTAIRNSRRAGPPFVDRVGLGEDLLAYVAEADVVANCLPMTPDTEDIFNAELFAAMKPTAFFINVGRGGTVDTDALVAALSNGDIAGAGLDVTDPEPLPEGHPLWKAPNLVITPHFAAWSDEEREGRWLLYRENLRRFVAGERLLSVVDPGRGY